jgi:Tfp pilus assembly protein PilO
MTITPFNRRLIVHLGVAVVAVFLLLTSIIILNIRASAQVNSILNQKKQIALRNRTIELLAGGNSDLKRAEPLLAQLQNVLPKKDQLISFSREIKKLAKDMNLEVGFSFGSEQSGSEKEPGSVNFSLSVTGKYEQVNDFLTKLEGHPYLIRIDGVAVSYQLGSQYNLTTNGVIYTK